MAVSPEVGSAGAEAQPDEPMEEEAEGITVKALPQPNVPSKEEYDRHQLTHIPYRSWCPHCIRGRGKNAAHQKLDKEIERAVPRLCVDYAFLGQRATQYKDGQPIADNKEDEAELATQEAGDLIDTSKDDKEGPGADGERLLPVMMAKDTKTSSTYSLPVPQKGAAMDYPVKALKDVVENLGYRRIILKMDRQASLR